MQWMVMRNLSLNEVCMFEKKKDPGGITLVYKYINSTPFEQRKKSTIDKMRRPSSYLHRSQNKLFSLHRKETGIFKL